MNFITVFPPPLFFLLGRPLFESCHNEISKVLNKKIHETAKIKDLDFYAFSYYYELAVDAGLIGNLAIRQ